VVDPGSFALSVVDGRMAVLCTECSWSSPAGGTVHDVVKKAVRHGWTAHPSPPPPLSDFDDAKLVYIDKRENIAYFSSDPDVSGDDWNDAPWEHNAEPPSESDVQVGWFGGEFERPGYEYMNSMYSVDDINRGVVPWLTQSYDRKIVIPAGVGVQEFMHLIAAGGGYAVVLPEDSGR